MSKGAPPANALLAVSYLTVLNPDFVEVLRRVRDSDDGTFHAVACQDVAGLRQAVSDAFEDGGPITRLDIHGHAVLGEQYMGDEVVAAPGWDSINPMLGYLSDDAEIRLLGCGAALGWGGYALLQQLQEAMGSERSVLGCSKSLVDCTVYGPDGLDAGFAAKWLVDARKMTAVLPPDRTALAGRRVDASASRWARRLGPGYWFAGRGSRGLFLLREWTRVVDKTQLVSCNGGRVILVEAPDPGRTMVFQWIEPSDPRLPALFLDGS